MRPSPFSQDNSDSRNQEPTLTPNTACSQQVLDSSSSKPSVLQSINIATFPRFFIVGRTLDTSRNMDPYNSNVDATAQAKAKQAAQRAKPRAGQNIAPMVRLPQEKAAALKSRLTTVQDRKMASQQTSIEKLPSEEQAAQHAWAQTQLMIGGHCLEGYPWVCPPPLPPLSPSSQISMAEQNC